MGEQDARLKRWSPAGSGRAAAGQPAPSGAARGLLGACAGAPSPFPARAWPRCPPAGGRPGCGTGPGAGPAGRCWERAFLPQEGRAGSEKRFPRDARVDFSVSGSLAIM